MENNNLKNEKSAKKKKKHLSIIIMCVIFAGIIAFGIYHFTSTLGGVPSDAKIISDDDLQNFIDEQKSQGIEVEIVE